MKSTSLAIAGLAAISSLGGGALAFAQTKPAPAKPAVAAAKPATAAPAAAPAAQLTANVPGVCVLSREGLLAASTVGKYVQTRLGQLTTQVNAELTGEQTSLQNDAKALEAKKSTLAPAAYQQQGTALQQRAQALQEKASQRDRELQATEQKAIQRVLTEATPLVQDQGAAKGCGIILDANAVLTGSPSVDLTPGVITGLNTKFTQFDFDRERLDAQAAPQQK